MVTASTSVPATDDQAEAIAAALGPDAALTLEYQPDGISARFDVQARTMAAAITNGIQRFTATLAAHGIEHELTDVQASSYEALERQLTEPQIPALVGVAEIAELLGVSRQRVDELTGRDDFPRPVPELASGKLYAAASIDVFVTHWPRKRTGRPLEAP